MSAAHDPHHDEMLYQAWVQVIEWMKQYASEKGVLFTKESDFPDFIYRMERPYELPTTMMAVSLSDERGEPFFFASVSPRHAKLKHVAFRVPGGHIHHHAHWEDGKGLALEGKIPLTREKLYQMADRARSALAR
ncbi:NADH-quinone oxidoreductase subunit 15 [Meiothermus sp.]|uniref:NADH-quinone oxidoreductase subunit 15 n=1 Tax=Meiothermus sp. TaxID=1955249 RepID=UPI0021DE1100|nr:NADH-quinone oxidoreductase subunit 15 [Meiothermus sp.]GIW32954.1 MAG: NADH-quinone oxidoreductase subunit 15 [Meiothermus sp.]